MRGRRALKGLAYGLIESFVSRNNDVQGYWGIGKLYGEALEQSGSSVCIDLIDQNVRPTGPAAGAIQLHYAGRLDRMASAAGVLLSEAHVIVEFGMFGSYPPPHSHSYGDAFVCTVSLVGSNGFTFKAARTGFCSPHDPARERCSTRASAP